MLFLIRFNNKINMDTLSCEQLMQIIVELDTSYKNEVKNKEFENRCLKGLLDSNEASDQSIEFISGTQCDLCGIKICVYKYRDEDDDDLEDETDVNEVFICKVCNNDPCTCLCTKCKQYPCECICTKCAHNPCVCPCSECGKKPCICIQRDLRIQRDRRKDLFQ